MLRKIFEFLLSLPTRIFGSRNERLLKQYSAVVAQINALEPALAKLSDPELRGKTEELKKRFADGATHDESSPRAFAVVRVGVQAQSAHAL